MTQFKAFTCVAFRINLIFISSCLLQSNCKVFVTFAMRPNKGSTGVWGHRWLLLSVMGYSAIFVLRAGMASRVQLFLAFVLNSLKTAETDISAQIHWKRRKSPCFDQTKTWAFLGFNFFADEVMGGCGSKDSRMTWLGPEKNNQRLFLCVFFFWWKLGESMHL